RSFSWQNSFCVLPLLFHTSINENINCRVVMSVELSIALLFSSKTIPSASSLKYVLYRWVTSISPSKAASRKLFSNGANAPSLPYNDLPERNCSRAFFLISSRLNCSSFFCSITCVKVGDFSGFDTVHFTASTISQSSGEAHLLINHLKQLYARVGKLPENIVADAGFGSEENFHYLSDKSTAYLKYTGYYTEQTTKHKQDQFHRDNMSY